MKGEETQPTRISKEEYIKFKQFVQDTHGTTRGHLKTEIENALREYRQPDNSHDKLARIEDDIATIKANIATAQTDGGGVAPQTESPDTHAHAESACPDTKPNKNAPRSKKVSWLISEYYEPEGGSLVESVLEKQIKDEFGFGDRTIEQYKQDIIDELGAKLHPEYEGRYVWGEVLERARQELQESAESEVKDEMERVS